MKNKCIFSGQILVFSREGRLEPGDYPSRIGKDEHVPARSDLDCRKVSCVGIGYRVEVCNRAEDTVVLRVTRVSEAPQDFCASTFRPIHHRRLGGAHSFPFSSSSRISRRTSRRRKSM